MAKELDIVIKVDGKDVNVAEQSIKQMDKTISELKEKLNNTPIGSEKFKELKENIDEVERGFRKAKDAQQPFLDSMGELDGVLGYVGRSIKGVGEAFDLLKMNPLIAAMTAFASVTLLVGEQLEKFAGVEETLKVVNGELGNTLDRIRSSVFGPLAESVKEAGSWFGDLIEKYREWKGLTYDTGKNTKESLEEIIKLELQAGDVEIERTKIQAKLSEAREKMTDPNATKEEKKKAIDESIEGEQKLSDLLIGVALKRAKDLTNIAIQGNSEIGQVTIESMKKVMTDTTLTRVQQSDMLRQILKDNVSADLGYTTEQIKNLQQAQTYISAIYAEDNRLNVAQRRLNNLNNTLDKKETKELTAEQKLALEQKTNYEKLGLDLRNKIRTEDAKTEEEKLRASTKNEENTMLDQINKSKLNDKQKKEILDLYQQYVIAKETETAKKVDDLHDKEFDKSFKNIQAKDQQEITKAKNKYELLKTIYGQDSEEAKKALEERFKLEDTIYKAELNALYDKQAAGYNLTEEELLEIDKLKLALGVLNNEKAKASAQDGKIFKEFEAQTKNYQNLYLGKKKFTEEFYDKEKDLIKKSLKANEEAFEQNKINEKDYLDTKTRLTAADIALEGQKQRAKEDTLNVIGKAFATASKLAGADTAEGKVLAIAGATIDTYAAADKALDIYGPTPIGFLAAATAIAEGLLNVQQIMAVQVPGTGSGGGGVDPNATKGANYAEGGMIDGPSHAQGGVNINAQGGEAVMTKGAVLRFGPLLSQLNQMGGGTSFTKSAIGMARQDAPKLVEPSNQNNILKAYVVGSELTSYQHKTARLKELSTL